MTSKMLMLVFSPPPAWWKFGGALALLSILSGTRERPMWMNLAMLAGLWYGYYLVLVGLAVFSWWIRGGSACHGGDRRSLTPNPQEH